VKVRGWLLMLLFAHVLLHPWVHVMGASNANGDRTSVSSSSTSSQHDVASGDQCELCRVGHNATVTPRLLKLEFLNPQWVRVTLQSVNYASLQAECSLPSRAPPSL
jgi:hypothetical protein